MADYTQIERPYDAVGNRTPGGTSPVINETSTLFSQPAEASSSSDPTASNSSLNTTTYTGIQNTSTVAGAVETQPVNTNQSINDLWINTFIRSSNYKPAAVGFNIDGQSGNAEFNNVAVRGTIFATTGQIGGFDIGATTITGGGITLDSAGAIYAGQTAYDTGIGFWLGVNNGVAEMSIGNSSGNKMTWDGSVLEIIGRLNAISSQISTSFESSSRFQSSFVGSGAATFSSNGVFLQSGTANPGAASLIWNAMPTNVFQGSPGFSTALDITTGNAFAIFCGLGNMTATTLDFTSPHIGFKIVGGFLYATQADGATEASVLLTTAANNDVINLVIRVEKQQFVDYYYRKYYDAIANMYNNDYSPVTMLSTNMPTAVTPAITFRVDNLATTSNVQVTWIGASYTS